MAWEQNPYAVKLSLVAAADLSAKQFTFVKLDGNTVTGTPSVIAASATGAYALGVLQNTPKPYTYSTPGGTQYNYGEAEVTISGITKVVAGSTNIVPGSRLAANNVGQAIVVSATNTGATYYILGTALSSSSAAGDIITMAVSTQNAVLSA